MGENVSPSLKVIAYDGTCILCHRSLQWILKRDSRSVFKYTQLQGSWIANSSVKLDNSIDSIAFIENQTIYYKSTAALKIASYLPYPYKALSILKWFPVFLRDGIYDFIAKNRYKWFGKSDQCMLPPKNWKEQFLP